jgi:hypothetical protein
MNTKQEQTETRQRELKPAFVHTNPLIQASGDRVLRTCNDINKQVGALFSKPQEFEIEFKSNGMYKALAEYRWRRFKMIAFLACFLAAAACSIFAIYDASRGAFASVPFILGTACALFWFYDSRYESNDMATKAAVWIDHVIYEVIKKENEVLDATDFAGFWMLGAEGLELIERPDLKKRH